MTIIQTTIPTTDSAKTIIQALLSKHLVACGKILPVMSWYSWKNNIRQDQEVMVWLETTDAYAEEARAILEELHPYETPVIACWKVKINDVAESWLEESV